MKNLLAFFLPTQTTTRTSWNLTFASLEHLNKEAKLLAVYDY